MYHGKLSWSFKEDKCGWMPLGTGSMFKRKWGTLNREFLFAAVTGFGLPRAEYIELYSRITTHESSLHTHNTGCSDLKQTYPKVSPCRCLHLSSSLCSGWPHSAPQKSQASSSTSSLLSHWLNSGLHSRRGGDTVHLHKSKDHITYCGTVCSSQSVLCCWCQTVTALEV